MSLRTAVPARHDAESSRAPSTIQPHGVLLALEEPSLTVVLASTNAGEPLGVAHQELLGLPIAQVLGAAGEKTLRAAIDGASLREANPMRLASARSGKTFDGIAHRSEGLLVLELEPAQMEGDTTFGRFYRQVRRSITRLREVQHVEDLARLAAEEVRRLTGFDRVIVYRFAADASGEVIAEAKRDDLEPYLGLRHPSSDIPTQARGLTVHRLRLIPDLGYSPAPLLPADNPLTSAPLDLSYSVLGSPSPSQIEHLKNKGVRAAMSISVVVDGALWGLIACHHHAPLFVPYEERAASEFLGEALAWQMAAREQGIQQRATELARLNDELRASNFAKDEFLATVSHELRTPLNAMLGWLQLIESGQLPASKREQAFATITRNARAQAQLVEDLLDVSRIVSGKLRLDVQSIDPVESVEAALAAVSPAADAKGIRVKPVLDPRAGPVLGDAGRLQQIVWNLLTNAVKFTPRGGAIGVSLRRVESSIEIVVSDDGAGIPQEFLSRVFERFSQANGAITRRHNGLGLGLSIVKHLVELHGGSVAVDSPGLGLGSTFTVRLPVSALRKGEGGHPVARSSSEPSPSLVPSPQLSGLRILVVDDEPDGNELLANVLAFSNVHVLTASSGPEALATLQRERPDILVSDIGMPEMDGYELIRRVRALPPDEGGRTPAVALTAFARTQDRSRAFRAGFDVYIPKPVDPGELVALLVSLAGRLTMNAGKPTGARPSPPPPPETIAGALGGLRVLLVEADPDAGRHFTAAFEDAGATIEAASSAEAAIEMFRAYRPDVLVSDVTLPDRDGIALLRELRAIGADDGGWIPAVALIGPASPEDATRALLAGFQVHMAKPVDPHALVARVVKLLGWTRS